MNSSFLHHSNAVSMPSCILMKQMEMPVFPVVSPQRLTAMLLTPFAVLLSVNILKVLFCFVSSSIETLCSHNNSRHCSKKLILVDGDLVESKGSVTCGLEECISLKAEETVCKSVNSKYTVNRFSTKYKRHISCFRGYK